MENYINTWTVKELLFSLQNACRKEEIIFETLLNTDNTIELRFYRDKQYYSIILNAESICKLVVNPEEYVEEIMNKVRKKLFMNHNNDLKAALNSIYGRYGIANKNFNVEIKKVIFNDPATIVFWIDGTKTVVKAHDEPFDKEKGLAMAISKKVLGTNKSKSNFNDVFKKWIPEDKNTLTKKYYTVKELSENELVTPDEIRRRIKNGLYPGAIKQSGAWLIPFSGLKR